MVFRPFNVGLVVVLNDPSARATRIHTPHTPSPSVSPPKFGNEHERLGVGAGGLFGGGAAYEHERFGEGRGLLPAGFGAVARQKSLEPGQPAANDPGRGLLTTTTRTQNGARRTFRVDAHTDVRDSIRGGVLHTVV